MKRCRRWLARPQRQARSQRSARGRECGLLQARDWGRGPSRANGRWSRARRRPRCQPQARSLQFGSLRARGQERGRPQAPSSAPQPSSLATWPFSMRRLWVLQGPCPPSALQPTPPASAGPVPTAGAQAAAQTERVVPTATSAAERTSCSGGAGPRAIARYPRQPRLGPALMAGAQAAAVGVRATWTLRQTKPGPDRATQHARHRAQQLLTRQSPIHPWGLPATARALASPAPTVGSQAAAPRAARAPFVTRARRPTS
mmetsp:Transcript_84622/g.274143  ORF Transcript_84622/g.274143 Transcript_84622/m.274143 type:complete len:258 (+) Transcript_84622:315-1088(+)